MSALGGLPPRRPDQISDERNPALGAGPRSTTFPILVVKGSRAGVFIYDGAGNLVDSMAFRANVDPLTHSNKTGIVSYTSALSLFAQLDGGILDFGSRNPSSRVTNVASVQLIDALAANATPILELTSPGTASGGFARLQLDGESADASQPAAFAFNTGGSISGTLEITRAGSAVFIIPPSGDTSGAADTAALAVLSVGSVLLLPGTYYLNSQITVAGNTLAGCDMATVIRPNTTGAPYTGPLLAAGNKGAISNLSVQSSGSDAITVAGGISEVWLTDLYFESNTGLCINWTVTGTTHGRIRGIRSAGGGAASGGGIAINGGTAGGHAAEINIYDVDIQNCQTSEVIFLSAVTDVTVDVVNGSIAAGKAANAITIQGACQTCHLDNLDVGGSSAGTGVCVVQAAGGNSPSDIWVQGKLQTGAVGLVVNDAVARSRFYVDCTRNQGDGAQFNGTGQVNKLMFMGNLNNQAAGVAYDINVTSSAHVYIDAPQYGSPGGGAVTANLNVAIAGNHVSHAGAPAGSTTAGNAPAGW